MSEPLGHERQLTFFQREGHDHDGENSTPVTILPGAISLFHLNSALREWIEEQAGDGGSEEDHVMPVPDLVFRTPPIAAGGFTTGSVPWVGLSIVRFMRVLMSEETECTITFYHKPTFADEDREFRVYRCANKFLWEGNWAHFDEEESKQIYYKVENTGNNSATFQITLKSGTMAANAYARFIEAIQTGGQEATGTVIFNGGNGVDISLEGNTFTFNASAPETVFVRRWALTPVAPVSYSSSTTITNVAYLSDGRYDRSAGFGSGLQWIQADLGAVKNLGGVRINQYQSDGRTFNGVRIQISADASNWIDVKSSGTAWATFDGIEIKFISGILARYIRVWCNGSTVNTSNYINKITPLALSDKE